MKKIGFLELLFSYCDGCSCVDRKANSKTKISEVNVDVKLRKLLSLDYGRDPYDFPENFMCPLMGTIMTEPVRVPKHDKEKGYVICDYAAIARWVSEHKTSPFDRVPMSLEDLKIDLDLKQKIYDYILGEIIAVESKIAEYDREDTYSLPSL